MYSVRKKKRNGICVGRIKIMLPLKEAVKKYRAFKGIDVVKLQHLLNKAEI